jgi:hypothetical protein
MSYAMYGGPRPPRRPVFSGGQIVLILGVIALVILGSGVLIYTSVTYNIAATNIRSTATAQANATQLAIDATNNAIVSSDVATAQVALTAEAQATAIAQAYANATATARAIANATATAKVPATATPSPNLTRDPYPPFSGTLTLNDPLLNNSQGHGWDVYSMPVNNNCEFVNGGYEVTQQNQNNNSANDISNSCVAEKTSFANFTFQVNMTITKGGCGGLEFRADNQGIDGYGMLVCASSTALTPASYWSFRLLASGGYSTLAQASSTAIHTAYGQTNVLAIVAIGSSLTFYANGQKMATVTDTKRTSGEIGVMVSGLPGVETDAIFHNAEVWTM